MSNDNDALMRALELAKQGDYETALILVRRLLKRTPDNRRAVVLRWTLEARLFESRGATDEAIARYEHIVSLRPDMAEAKRKLEELSAARSAVAAAPDSDPELSVEEVPDSVPPRDSDRPTHPPVHGSKAAPMPRNAPPPPPSPPAADRRQSRRVFLDVDIGVSTDSNFYTGFSDDISEGGLFIATYNQLPVGSRVTIKLTLPTGQHLETEVEVCWVREADATRMETDVDAIPGMGVRFVGLKPEHRAAIQSFMRKRAPFFYDQ